MGKKAGLFFHDTLLQCSVDLDIKDLQIGMLLFSHWVCPTLRPHGLSPTRLLCLWISQARILEWVAISSSGDLPKPGIKPASLALAGRLFTTEPPGKPLKDWEDRNKADLSYKWHDWQRRNYKRVNNNKKTTGSNKRFRL